MRRPLVVYPLLLCLLFLGSGGLYGGLAMLADPSGGSLTMDVVLPLLPVPDYTAPGLFLLFFMGVVPLILIYALMVRPDWPWLRWLSRWSGHYWAWALVVILVLLLGIFLIVQAFLIGFDAPIQIVTASVGLLIFLFVLSPGVRNYYAS